MLTERKLGKLSKRQLLHLLTDVIGDKEVAELWRKNREAQSQLRLQCWDCESIEKIEHNAR